MPPHMVVSPDLDDDAATVAAATAMAEAEVSTADRPSGTLQLDAISPVGVVGRVLRIFQLPDERTSGLVQLLRRAQPVEVLRSEPFPITRVLYPGEVVPDDAQLDATFRQMRMHLHQFFDAHPNVTEELKVAAHNIDSPGLLADFVGQHLARDVEERLEFLCELDLNRRTHRGLEVTLRELDLLTIGNRISDEIRGKVEKNQREFFLREQLKSIRTELGEEADPSTLAVTELKSKLEAAGLPESARNRADDELKRLQMVPIESPEHHVVRSYLEWIAALPWSKTTEDDTELTHAREVLNRDHYGLEEVKERIVEFLAVRRLKPDTMGSILCFAGPPGVGKTSLGKSIARALGREFYRFSVGGMRDEAEIKGHRKTYVGAMPGRILQALKQVQSANPVILLDELDKMGSDWRGDPSSAMLEVLDPAQNQAFLDHYLDLTFDLQRVMFIGTANVKSDIPAPLLDRLEIIDLPGYIPEEKVEIARRHLVPRQRTDHGLQARNLRLGTAALTRIIRAYTQEAGVRELNRSIGRLCRKRATEIVESKSFEATVRATELESWLGPPKVVDDRLSRKLPPGVVVGLAWTPVGGEILFIEGVTMPGKGRARVTGKLGDVMNESAQLALSYVHHRAQEFGIDESLFESRDFHLHFPAGAVPKDGPSAGVAITTTLVSLLTRTPVLPRVAMTGEMTLRGEVLAVGGIREKVVAARRAGVRTVIVPARNRADVERIPETVRDKLSFVFAESFDDVQQAALKPVDHAPPRSSLEADRWPQRTPKRKKKARARVAHGRIHR